MALTFTALEVPLDSYSSGNSVLNYTITGTSSADKTVRAAVTSNQIYFRGHIRASAATVITIKSGTGGTAVAVMEFLAAGTQEIPKSYTASGALLEFTSTNTVTVGGVIKTLAVAASQQVPPVWVV